MKPVLAPKKKPKPRFTLRVIGSRRRKEAFERYILSIAFQLSVLWGSDRQIAPRPAHIIIIIIIRRRQRRKIDTMRQSLKKNPRCSPASRCLKLPRRNPLAPNTRIVIAATDARNNNNKTDSDAHRRGEQSKKKKFDNHEWLCCLVAPPAAQRSVGHGDPRGLGRAGGAARDEGGLGGGRKRKGNTARTVQHDTTVGKERKKER
jgi:hypothetical protein